METFIRDAFVKKEHVVVVFLTWQKRMTPLGNMAFYVTYMCFLTWKKRMTPLGSMAVYVTYMSSELKAD